VRYLEASVARKADDPMIQYHLGKAYAQTGDRAKARAALQRAIAANVPFDGVDDARQVLAGLPD
jgi:predicted Zn-dependent protease